MLQNADALATGRDSILFVTQYTREMQLVQRTKQSIYMTTNSRTAPATIHHLSEPTTCTK